MKVLDLQCSKGHTFEGWFASEDDFVSQCNRSLVQCPLCGDAHVQKKLSAPRLNLSTRRQDNKPADGDDGNASTGKPAGKPAPAAQPLQADGPTAADPALAAAWLELSRRVLANSQDVGERFAEEARKMHYGEAEERSIRGVTSVDEARALVEEGIDILPMLLPESLKKTLQ